MGPLGSQTHAQAQKEGKNLSQNFSKKYVLDEPTQQTEPKLGEDRTSKKLLKLFNFRGAREVSTSWC